MRIGSPYGLALTTKPTKHLLTNIVSIQDTWVARKILSHIFTAAIKEDIVDTNPCSQVRRLKVIHIRDITKAVGKKYSEHFSHWFKGLGMHNFTFHNLRHTLSSL